LLDRCFHSSGKQLLSLPVSAEQISEQACSELRLRILLNEDIELLPGTIELPGKAQQLEEKSAKPFAGRLLPQLNTEGLNRLGKTASAKMGKTCLH
jgi:hypothetical protein